MPYPPRVQFAGALYHVTTRGVDRQPIVRSDVDRSWWMGTLGETVRRLGVVIHAFCLMDNHYHLLAETPHANIARALQWLNGTYALAHNRRHARVGHLFQSRFHAVVIEKERHLYEVARYVVLNPVRAGMCASPGEWRWSSYRATAGFERCPRFLALEWLWSLFGREEDVARRRYVEFVNEGCPHDSLAELLSTF